MASESQSRIAIPCLHDSWPISTNCQCALYWSDMRHCCCMGPCAFIFPGATVSGLLYLNSRDFRVHSTEDHARFSVIIWGHESQGSSLLGGSWGTSVYIYIYIAGPIVQRIWHLHFLSSRLRPAGTCLRLAFPNNSLQPLLCCGILVAPFFGEV